MEPFNPALDLSSNKTMDFVCFVDTRIIVRKNNDKINQLRKQYNELLRRKEYLEAIKKYYINPKPSVSPLKIDNKMSITSGSKGQMSSVGQSVGTNSVNYSFSGKKYNIPLHIVPKKYIMHTYDECYNDKIKLISRHPKMSGDIMTTPPLNYNFDGDTNNFHKSEQMTMASFKKTITQLQEQVYVPKLYEPDYDGDQLNIFTASTRNPINKMEEIAYNPTITYYGDDAMLGLLNSYLGIVVPSIKIVRGPELPFDEYSFPTVFDIEI